MFFKIFLLGPAPVSLPEQSKITSFKNEPVAQTENEDDLNDSVIE